MQKAMCHMTNEDIYLQKSTSLQHHWVRNPCTRCGRRGSDNRTVPGAHWCFQANIQFLENILQSLKESMMTVQHHHTPRFVGWALPPFSAFVGSPADAAQWEKLVTSSSSAKQHLPPEQLGRVDIPNTTDLPGPRHTASCRSRCKGSKSEPARSCSMLYKPYQISRAGTSSSQPKDKPGKHVSPSRINFFKAWLTTPFNPTSNPVCPQGGFFNLVSNQSIMTFFWWFGTIPGFSLDPQSLV